MRGVRSCTVVLLAVALVLPVAQPAAVSAADPREQGSSKGGDGDASAAVLAGLSITSPGPLSSITISPDLNCAVNHVADTVGEFYGDTACATLLAANGVLYGPASIPAGGSASPRTAFTPVSQILTGTGSRVPYDPYRITTVVAVACVAARERSDGTLVPGGRIEEWQPISAGSTYFEGLYDDLWAAIGTQQLLPNTSRDNDNIDNGAGLSWGFLVPAGSEETRANRFTITSLGCYQEELVNSVGSTSDQVMIRYDARYLWPENDSNYLARAEAMATAIKARAEATLEGQSPSR